MRVFLLYIAVFLITLFITLSLLVIFKPSLNADFPFFDSKPHYENRIEYSGIEKPEFTYGVSWVDFDNDGYDDLFFAGGPAGSKLYKNNEGNEFLDVTPPEFRSIKKASVGVFADYNNDGCKDLFIAERLGLDKLFMGNCYGNFMNVTKQAGLKIQEPGGHNYGVAWADYNGDGYLDIYIAAHGVHDFEEFSYTSNPNILYKNNGDGTFTDLTEKAGVSGFTECGEGLKPRRIQKMEGPYKQGYQPVWLDYNNDNLIDLFVAIDRAISPLYKNNGDGTFTDVTLEAGMCRVGSNMGVAVGDYNNDGYLDIYTTNVYEDFMWKNNGDGTFSMLAKETGTGDMEAIGWGTGFIDYDNDGYLDLYVTNGSFDLSRYPMPGRDKENLSITREDSLYRNDGAGSFINVAKEEGIEGDFPKLASAFGDYNNDGFSDIISVPYPREDIPIRLYENKPNGNNWMSIKLIGTKSNKDGIGARITLTSGGKKQIREVSAGTSFLSQNSFVQNFGIGKAKEIDKVEVLWPSGEINVVNNIQPSQNIVIEEPM